MKIKFVSTAGNWQDKDCYGYVDKNFVRDMVKMNAVVEGAKKHGLNYYILPNNKLVHVYNVFEIN